MGASGSEVWWVGGRISRLLREGDNIAKNRKKIQTENYRINTSNAMSKEE